MRPEPSRASALVAALASGAALLALCGAPTGSASRPQQQPPPTQARAVRVAFTVVDREGKLFTELRREDVRVSVDGQPQPFDGFERWSGAPVRLAVMLDTSASQESVLPDAKRAAAVFVERVLRPGVDHAAVITYANAATLEQEMTADLGKVRDAVGRAQVAPHPGRIGLIVIGPPPPSLKNLPGSTGMWDALLATAEGFFPPVPSGGRRAVLLITDGIDTNSRVKSDEAIAALIKSGVAVYAIGATDSSWGEIDKGALRKAAERTGGRAFFPKKGENLLPFMSQIRDELLAQYVVTFAPPPPRGKSPLRKLQIELVNPELRRRGLQVAAPQGYFADAAGH